MKWLLIFVFEFDTAIAKVKPMIQIFGWITQKLYRLLFLGTYCITEQYCITERVHYAQDSAHR